MSYNINTLILFSVAMMNVTVGLFCGLLLLWKRKEVPDRSRTIFAVPMLMSVAVYINKMVTLVLHPEANVIMEVLSPFVIFTAPISELILLAYPMEVLRPNWLTLRRALPLVMPLLLLCAPAFMVSRDFFTPLYSSDDFLAHLGEMNVWWRLMVMPLIIFYAVLLTSMPYRWRESSASQSWLKAYVTVFCIIGVFLLLWMITQNPVYQICHNLSVLIMIAVFTWLELMERLPSVPMYGVDGGGTFSSDRDDLWQRIVNELHSEQLWRNPNLSLDMLCDRVGSNKNYVTRCFRQNADTTFNDYVNRMRVDYMAEELLLHPYQSHKELYFRAGFRSKTTAFMNFKKYKQVSPTEYLAARQTK